MTLQEVLDKYEEEDFDGFPKVKVWYMYCSTGCTCCSDENFYQGFYSSKEEAEKIRDKYLEGKGNPLSSQYAKYGRYSIYEEEAEVLPDGRLIVDDVIHEGIYSTWRD